MDVLITTILRRPYVFIFLISFLTLGRIYWGWKKTFLWLFIGCIVAWASEVSSIHNGFPYGLYYYRYENMVGELMVAGVPFWDSLSYPFLIYAGYTTAQFILCRAVEDCHAVKQQDSKTVKQQDSKTIKTAFFGAFLTMLLDIIIDPLTVLGDRWFLGNIYYYPNGGQYFGVPLTNFAGWFIVPLAVILVFLLITYRNPPIPPLKKGGNSLVPPFVKGGNSLVPPFVKGGEGGFKYFLNPLFYLSIALFNIIITIWINEPLMASIDCFFLIPIVGLIIWRIRRLTANR